MAMIRFAKVVTSLPGVLVPDTVYLLRTGAGFDLYVSDMTGAFAHALNGNSSPMGNIDGGTPSSIPLVGVTINGGTP
jgi:hypothetical protein